MLRLTRSFPDNKDKFVIYFCMSCGYFSENHSVTCPNCGANQPKEEISGIFEEKIYDICYLAKSIKASKEFVGHSTEYKYVDFCLGFFDIVDFIGTFLTVINFLFPERIIEYRNKSKRSLKDLINKTFYQKEEKKIIQNRIENCENHKWVNELKELYALKSLKNDWVKNNVERNSCKSIDEHIKNIDKCIEFLKKTTRK